MPAGIHAYSSYLPAYRLDHQAIAEALEAGPGRGSRTVASYDQDSTTLGVEAARALVGSGRSEPDVVFSTTSPAYEDKTAATTVRAALGLGHRGGAVDVSGSARSAGAAMTLGAAKAGLTVLADLRSGAPGSADEREGSDGAAAFLWGPADGAAATVVAEASASAEFLDRWRLPGERTSRTWEERFGLERYVPLAVDAGERALKDAGIEGADWVVVSSPHTRAAATIAKRFERGGTLAQPAGLGFAGAADAGLRLAWVLDRAQPGDRVMVLSAVDGCDAFVLQITDEVTGRRAARCVDDQLAATHPLPYARFLSWKGFLDRDRPRRPEPDKPGGPPSARSEAWKFAFVGSRCTACGRVHLPPGRVCSSCGAVDETEPHPVADREGTVATFTVDRLAFSPSPPMTDVVVDFDGGGRYTCELTDNIGAEVAIGDRVSMTFRRLYTTEGIHNYFWKARPSQGAAIEGEGA